MVHEPIADETALWELRGFRTSAVSIMWRDGQEDDDSHATGLSLREVRDRDAARESDLRDLWRRWQEDVRDLRWQRMAGLTPSVPRPNTRLKLPAR